jgi:ribosomal protein S18 acetylase RimI-like enzyme
MAPSYDFPATIRDAVATDLGPVVALDATATGLSKQAYWSDIFQRYIESPRTDRHFLVAETAGEIIGFIVGETRIWEFGSPPSGWVFAVNVHAARREHGIGSRLMEAICGRFRAAGVATVRTMISRDDTLNLSFFRSLGMTAGPYIELEKSLEQAE